MAILHPVYLIIFGVLLFAFALNDRMRKTDMNKLLLFAAVLMIIMAGGRTDVGADYPVYSRMYRYGFPMYTTYLDVWRKATFQENAMEIEWLFVLINKIFFDFGMPFYVLTFLFATISVTVQYRTFLKYSEIPALSMLSYFMAIYFFTDSGQMRQGLGTAICVYSLRYIIARDLKGFLICMFIALGMHKSTVIFLPAYWIATLPFMNKHWIPLLITSVILAPFQVYNLFGGLITSLTPADVANAYEGYSQDHYYGQEMETGAGDFINIFFILFILIFDKTAQRKIAYYEYYRNLALFGYCLYYIFRGNTIFATRLPGVYIVMAGYFAIPGVVKAVQEELRITLKFVLIAYFLGYSFLFSRVNADRARFTVGKYDNVLW